LHTDFRPPSAGPYPLRAETLERLESQGKDIDEVKADKVAATGRYYRYMIEHVKHVLGDIRRVCPAYDPRQGYELAGFVWFQGWNDMVDRGTYPHRDKPGGYDGYTECLAHFIRDVRRDLDSPGLPFVIGVMGVNGRLEPGARYTAVHANFRAAMAAPASMPEFEGNVAAVQTAPFWDEKLAAIAEKMAEVKNMARMLRTKHKDHANRDGTMSPEEQRAYVDKYREEIVGTENIAMFERGASNAGYHYLGCAKTMAGIGWAFAEAILTMEQ
jgi:alpha-galactosidase